MREEDNTFLALSVAKSFFFRLSLSSACYVCELKQRRQRRQQKRVKYHFKIKQLSLPFFRDESNMDNLPCGL